MAGASLKKATKSPHAHRERRQLEGRKKLGMLEKKKDYKIRADDFNRKKRVLKRLRTKALDKNPDEFYFHMINSRTEDGQHEEKGKEETMTPDQIKLLQTRDLNYVVHKRTMEKNKIERLKSTLHLLDTEDGSKNTHKFFVDSEKEKREFDLAERLGTHPDLVGRAYNRPRLEDLKKASSSTSSTSASAQQRRQKSYRELQQRIEREEKLGVVQAKMEARKHLQNKKEKPSRIVKQETKESAPVIRWPMERKR